MVDFAALSITTKTLIDANGRAVSIRKLGESVTSDDQKPWRVDTEPVQTTVSGNGVFVTDHVREGIAFSMAATLLDGMATSNAVLLFPAADDDGELLEGFHEVVDGDRTWRIMRVEILQPGDTRLLYAIEVV